MIVMLVRRQSNGDEYRTLGGIECDVEGCGIMAPSKDELTKVDKNLMQLGWFIAPGQHRCPKHFHEDTPARGVQHREEALVTKRI